MAALIDVGRLLKHPALGSVLADQDAAKANADLEQMGLSLQHISGIAVFSDGKLNGLMIRFTPGCGIRERLDASPHGEGFSVAAMQVNGRRIYRVSSAGRNESGYCTFVGDDLLLCSEEQQTLDKYFALAKLPKKSAEKFAAEAGTVVLWGFWRNDEPAPTPREGEPVEGRVESMTASLDFAGEKKSDIVISTDIHCNTANYAAMLGMMIPGYLSVGSGIAFADAPELGEELLKNFKSSPKGNTLRLSLRLSERIVDHLTRFSTRMVKDQINPPAAGKEQPSRKAASAPDATGKAEK